MKNLKTFYDPHPGLMGAMIPIPEAVRKVANELNGKRMTLEEAAVRLQAVTSGEIAVIKEYKYISLQIKEGNGTIHEFRVIRFKD